MSSVAAAALPFRFRQFPPSPVHSTAYPLRHQPHAQPPACLRKVHESSLVAGAALPQGGLRTPPAEDDMSTAYHNPALSNAYDSHVALARQPSTLIQSGRPGAAFGDSAINPFARAQPHQQHHQQHHQQPRPQAHQQPQHQHPRQHPHAHKPQAYSQSHSLSSFVPQSNPTSRHSTRPSSPASTGTLSAHSEGTLSRRESTMVTHSLQLPSCISPNGGNLDDFAALMTCFFWFETMDTIQAAEQIKTRRTSDLIPRLSKYTDPCSAYKKWVNSILSTTQVTQNVVLLALLFVYRLKKTNPKVNGNPGSEYRLLTVALMLGNKFLDDNTYTNKTWAEVSGITVKEIHVMEVEFLSNMRYGLLTSKSEWEDWLTKLACYHEYYERAKADETNRQAAQVTPIHLSSPNHGRYGSPLPSPTSILPPGTQGTLMAAYSPNAAAHQWNGSYHPTPTVTPHAAQPGARLTRKRSLEGGDPVEPAPKRVPRQPAMPMAPTSRMTPRGESYHPMSSGPRAAGPESVRLPVPQLTLDTSQAAPPNAYNHSMPSVSLPPLGHGMRAMSTVYSTPSTTWAPQGPTMATCGPQTPSYVVPSNYGTPTKRHSPPGVAAFGSSPLAEAYASHTPISNSPSVYLQQRASPYKPVRRVNTLLNPPPSIPLSEYHLGSSQMHYQPIGRRNDLRSGIVPEFLPHYGNTRLANHHY
ncbi:hypothetical protein GGR56DRAFT_312715 [Xylariaceae sp. FL0804]|nr:hypothetical protein GGR56DRAFT_312715 [Xylariaceae sp. FL0804]